MSTKFVSKNSNYMIVLKPGIEGNRNLGTHAVSGLYVKFQAGVVDVKEDAIIKMLREHPGFGTDFIEIKPEEADPYLDTREEIEPPHVISEIHYGHSEAVKGTSKKVKLTPQMKKIIESEALKMIPGLLKANPKILKDIILELAAEMKTKDSDTTNVVEEPIVATEEKRGPGRPPKVE
jgi:hypothetical protein